MLYLFCCCLMEMSYFFCTSQSTVKAKLADAVSSLSFPLTWMLTYILTSYLLPSL